MISKTAIRAIRALATLAELQEGECAGAATVAATIGAPPNYLGKLLQTLAREGLVESRKGLGGGFRLARDPNTISLLDVVEPVEHLGRWSSCLLGRPECSEETPCAVHDRWAGLRDAYLRVLSETTIADVVGESVNEDS